MTRAENVASSFLLRAARDADVQALGAIEATAFADPWPASAFRDMIASPRARVTVAVDQTTQAIAGYCVLLVVADEAEVANLAVASSVRRRGLGAQLLDYSLNVAVEAGAIQVYLEVRASNAGAKALYASRGFAIAGNRRAYYRHPTEDALVLKWLAPGLLSRP